MSGNYSVAIRLTAWIMALCPLSLAVLFHTGFHSVPLAIHAQRHPSLAFNQYAVDRRNVNPAPLVEASYLFQNRGNEPVQISKVDVSCGCLTTKIQGARDNVIEPGGQGRLVVHMQTANATPGPHEYTITVKYTDPDPREVQLLFKVEIPATLWVTPSMSSVYHPRGSTPTIREFTVTDGRGKSFDITDVSINTELVETAIGESRRTQSGNRQQQVLISIAGELPPGRKTYTLRIKTTDAEISELQVPIMLEGEAYGEIEHALDHESTQNLDLPAPTEVIDSETVESRKRLTSNDAADGAAINSPAVVE